MWFQVRKSFIKSINWLIDWSIDRNNCGEWVSFDFFLFLFFSDFDSREREYNLTKTDPKNT